jgi:ubiquinone/menaquinone biosynthesis C-methylase UbiE
MQCGTKVPRNDKMTYYDEISSGYEELHREEQLKKLDLISRYFKPNKNNLLLDVGCGTGLTTKPWQCRKIGLDPAIKLLKRAGNGVWINAEAENIPFQDNTFDIVVSITAIQNFHDIEKGLNEIKRVGKDRFVLSFLKKGEKADKIKKLIEERFDVKEIIEQEKDLIFLI